MSTIVLFTFMEYESHDSWAPAKIFVINFPAENDLSKAISYENNLQWKKNTRNWSTWFVELR